MEIAILDYESGKVEVFRGIPSETDVEDFVVSNGFNLGSVEYMTADNIQIQDRYV